MVGFQMPKVFLICCACFILGVLVSPGSIKSPLVTPSALKLEKLEAIEPRQGFSPPVATLPSALKGTARRTAKVFEMPLWWCPHLPNSHERLLRELRGRKPGLVIDGGAYDGKDAVDFAKQGHRVISIEPTPGRKQTMLQNYIKASKFADRIEYHQIALTNYTGTVNFNVMGIKHYGTGQDQIDDHPYNFTYSVQVKADTLDNLIGSQHVLWMKIDTQGHDARVLKGAHKTLSEGRVDVLTFEMSPGLTPNYHEYEEEVGWLFDNDYICFDCHSFSDIAKNETFTTVEMKTFLAKMRESHGRGWSGQDMNRDTDIVCMYQFADN